MSVYSVSGVKCLRKYNAECHTWAFIPIRRWRRMSKAERSIYHDRSDIQVRAAFLTGVYYRA